MADALNDEGLDAGTGPARTFLLNDDGDVAFVNGGMVLARGPVAAAQEMETRFKWWVGESIVDVTAGIDFRAQVFTKPPDIPGAQSVFRREALATTGVTRASELQATFFSGERRLTLSGSATYEDGTALPLNVEV